MRDAGDKLLVRPRLGRDVYARGSPEGMDVIRTTVFLVDLDDFESMNSVYATYFDLTEPARSTVQVAALPKGARIEIDAIAIIR